MTIIFYDIPSALPRNAWSPNTFKARYALNFKGIPYKTEWVEYPDIEPVAKKLGIPPTTKKLDGSPHYTLPAIYDPSTKTYVSDSRLIVEYLEKEYPDTPSLFPHNTVGLQLAFSHAFGPCLDALWEFILPVQCLKLNPRSAEYFRRTREADFGKTLEEVIPKGDQAVIQWAKYKDGMGKVDAWYTQNGGKGPFLMGETLSWADVVVVSWTIWVRIIFGEDSQQWKDLSSWHGGRWNTLVENLEKYETVL
ncbi:hypothetical protein GALMADRAFT_89092 [Galerina marginata CBS 339.88]|uniref:GST N-terminal domain-containing protein n=1 Tax=Galerina marginata (strain CBS 339.88) TaxID=685588 RepID=A0A067TW62_GALM3|nr:hypothetical protein GALMADRAFT_89092 [Galerina marginata CBS 339.88]